MKKNYKLVLLVLIIFFVISFLTNIIGPLVPEIIRDFNLTKGMAGLLPFAFFIAYGFVSIPAGLLTDKYNEKKVLLGAFGLSFLGAITFSVTPSFGVALFSLFCIGMGMAFLQVAINPLLRVAGGEENFAFNSVLAQLFFGGASFLSPMVYSYLVTNIGKNQQPDFLISNMEKLVPLNLPWVSLYWIFAFVSLIMLAVILFWNIPKVQLTNDEKTGNLASIKMLLKSKTVWLFFFGIFAYVGTEQGVANWMSQFLYDNHQIDPQTDGAKAISLFWGMLTIGCFLGLGLLKVLDSKLVLRIFSVLAISSLALALYGNAFMAYYGFIAVGFFASVMWSVIFSLALNSVAEHHGSFSGILCTGIIGGAIMPLIIGNLADFVGLKYGMHLIFVSLLYILSISFWAKPLIKNKTIFN